LTWSFHHMVPSHPDEPCILRNLGPTDHALGIALVRMASPESHLTVPSGFDARAGHRCSRLHGCRDQDLAGQPGFPRRNLSPFFRAISQILPLGSGRGHTDLSFTRGNWLCSRILQRTADARTACRAAGNQLGALRVAGLEDAIAAALPLQYSAFRGCPDAQRSASRRKDDLLARRFASLDVGCAGSSKSQLEAGARTFADVSGHSKSEIPRPACNRSPCRSVYPRRDGSIPRATAPG